MLPEGTSEQQIADVDWLDPDANDEGISSTEEMIAWLRDDEHDHCAWVGLGANRVEVTVVNVKRPYLRTVADGKPTKDLLALPGGPLHVEREQPELRRR